MKRKVEQGKSDLSRHENKPSFGKTKWRFFVKCRPVIVLLGL